MPRDWRAGQDRVENDASNLDTVFSELSLEVVDRGYVVGPGPKVGDEIVFTAIDKIDHVRRYN